MNEDGSGAAAGEAKRPIASRVGLVLLNLLGPGLGALRAGSLHVAAILLAVPFVAFITAVLLFRILPDLDLTGFLIVAIGVSALTILNLVMAMVLTWRESRVRRVPTPPHARWYVVVGVMIATLAVWFALTADRDVLGYRTFYVPSEAMAPTLLPEDRFVARMRTPEPLQRGQVVLHHMGDAIFVKRIAGLPGDRIALRGGIVVLNGAEVQQRPTGRQEHVSGRGLGMTAREFVEQFPDEAGQHLIYDIGHFAELDDVEEVVVPADHLYLLGDNRDESADSRLPIEMSGTGFVPVTAIRGYALFHFWPGGSRPSGTRIDD